MDLWVYLIATKALYETNLKCPVWYATIALALSTASDRSNSPILGCATGKLHKNLASLSMSPDSSKVSQTVATWLAVKFNVGNANSGLGAKIGWLCALLKWKWWCWWLLKWCIGGDPWWVKFVMTCDGGELEGVVRLGEFGDVEPLRRPSPTADGPSPSLRITKVARFLVFGAILEKVIFYGSFESWKLVGAIFRDLGELHFF